MGGAADCLRSRNRGQHGAQIAPHGRRLLVPGAAQGALAVLCPDGPGSNFVCRRSPRPEPGVGAGDLAGLLWRSAHGSGSDVSLSGALDGHLISCAGDLGSFPSRFGGAGFAGRGFWLAPHYFWRLHTLEARWLNNAALHRPHRPISIS